MTKKIEQETVTLLSPTEIKRLQATKSANKQREFLLSRALMRHAFSRQFKCPEKQWTFIERPGFLPEILNLPDDIYVSLSHSHGLICFAIYNSPIGIDLETTGKKRDFLELAETFMDDEELENLRQQESGPADSFYRSWCAKEAYYKALPLQDQASVSFKEISIPNIFSREKIWTLLEGKIKQTRLSVVMKHRPKEISYHCFPQTVHSELTETEFDLKHYK
ncbi:MAG: 4'-phosphopantetheinyl transferase superfamily protein [Amphritea sp.]